MSLKVFDLQCGNGHVFEGWFSAANSFDQQASRGLLSCPVCGDVSIERKLSAPRINLGRNDLADTGRAANRTADGPHADDADTATGLPQLAELQGKVLQHMRKLVKESENVGPRFAQEALKIHQGQAKERAIRGTATPEERRELLEEGIGVLPVPDFLNDDQLQ